MSEEEQDQPRLVMISIKDLILAWIVIINDQTGGPPFSFIAVTQPAQISLCDSAEESPVPVKN